MFPTNGSLGQNGQLGLLLGVMAIEVLIGVVIIGRELLDRRRERRLAAGLIVDKKIGSR